MHVPRPVDLSTVQFSSSLKKTSETFEVVEMMLLSEAARANLTTVIYLACSDITVVVKAMLTQCLIATLSTFHLIYSTLLYVLSLELTLTLKIVRIYLPDP